MRLRNCLKIRHISYYVNFQLYIMKSASFIRKFSLLIVILCCSFPVMAQHDYDEPFIPETDLLVVKNLDQWQDLKFGFMMHWGAYCQWGVVESWSICSEDVPWCERRGPYAHNYVEYKKHYEMLPQTFNPVKFNPDKWAQAAKDAGMKYVVFTTKHHDGFCMYDTKYTDYKITDASVPFHTQAKADITKEVFQSFSKQGFMIGAYFSKPDWHHPDYWAPDWATPNRNVNYNTRKHPERWERFKEFTYNQIEELMTNYGKVDILWLDGGQVCPFRSEAEEKKAAERGLWNQDIDMANIAKMARNHQPGLIVVDRTVTGPYENYRTPEQQIPDKPLPYPWETCMTMASSWSYVPDDTYKPTQQIIHMLVDIVAKGGNYLLNVGPGPDGEFHDQAYQRLKEIGAWMKVNGDAIYGTHPKAPYKQDKVCYTSKKDGSLYGIYLADEGENMPAVVLLKGITADRNARVNILGIKGNCKWKQTNDGIQVTIPENARKNPPSLYAWAIKVSAVK